MDNQLISVLRETGFTVEYLTSTTWIAYCKNFYPPESQDIFNKVWKEHPTEYKTIKMYGKDVQIPRYQQAYGNGYMYSGIISESVPETPLINTLKDELNKLLSKAFVPLFNMCLCNWYEPDHYIGPHSDDTRQLYANSPIASISWGATRKFILTSKETKEKKELLLENGDIIIMGGTCQHTHKHEIAKLKKKDIRGNRINFTFRCFKV